MAAVAQDLMGSQLRIQNVMRFQPSLTFYIKFYSYLGFCRSGVPNPRTIAHCRAVAYLKLVCASTRLACAVQLAQVVGLCGYTCAPSSTCGSRAMSSCTCAPVCRSHQPSCCGWGLLLQMLFVKVYVFHVTCECGLFHYQILHKELTGFITTLNRIDTLLCILLVCSFS